jgi:hypothetical protein
LIATSAARIASARACGIVMRALYPGMEEIDRWESAGLPLDG